MGAPELIWNYPFYTVDSTTWIGGAAYGRIVMPGAFKPGTTADLYSGRVMRSADHVITMGPDNGREVRRFLKQAGVTESDLKESYIARAKVMALVIEDLVGKRAAEPCRFERWTSRIDGGWLAFKLFAPPLQAIADPKLKIFNVAWGNVMNHICNVTNHNDRLMSYLNIAKWEDEDMSAYIETGFPTPYVYKGRP
jgi:hypothetical protein